MSIQTISSEGDTLRAQTVAIVSAFAANNHLTEEGLLSALRRVHDQLRSLDRPVGAVADAPEPSPVPQLPAVSIKKSVTPDYIICLEDGQKVKMLRRHLKTRYNMSPEQYRAKWSLPSDYPMTAPNYAARRSELAKKIGLGRKQGVAPTRGRRKKVA